jgi:uncharacterized Zn finger protein
MGHIPFDLQFLSDQSGPKVFARGEAYAEAGLVEIIDAADDAVLAHVEGTETYVVQLTPSAGLGLCTCPAFDDFGVCKHVVATAVVYNGLSEVELRAARSRFARLREGLDLESREELVARIIGLARRYPAVLADLEGLDENRA